MKFAIINSLIITTLLACKSVQSILVGANSSNSNVQQQTEQNVNNDLTAAQTIQSNISQSNLKLSDGSNNSSKELDSSSTFYYEADAFLLNKPPLPQPVPDYKRDKTSASTLSVSGTTTKNATGEQVAAASFSSISGRNGRMLDLDALVGDLEASRANKQRLQSGARQSRNLQLSQQLQNLDLGSGSGKRRLHIQGFIPIVGVRDDEALSQPDPDRDDNQQPDSSIKPDDYLYSTALKQHQQHQHQQPQRQKSLMSHRQLSMVPMIGGASNELGNSLSQSSLPYGGGQSSIGHASFNVQRYLNPEGQQQQQQDTSSNHIGQSQQVDAKYSAHFGPSSSSSSSSSSSVVETLKKPIKKLTSSLVGAASGSSSDIKDLTAFGSSLNGAQQNCLCVPFYMCKSGFISESSLGRSQMQQLISQQQQQQQQQQLAQQPRQLTLATNGNQQLNGDQLAMQSVTNGAAVRPGTVESVPAAASLSPSYANSFVTVDERSFDREIVTAPPQQSSGASSSTDQLEQATNSSSSPSQLDALNQLIGDNQLDSAKPGGGGGSSGQQGFNELQSNQAGNNNSSQVQQVSGTATLSDEQQAAALNNSLQSNDYSQEILGRMLGLKAPSLPFVSSSSSAAPARSQHSSTGGGACGLLRTCCNIVANQPAQPQPQPQQQQQQQQQHFLAPSSTQLQQISRMQQQQQQQLYSPINNNLVSNHHYTEPMQLQQQQSSPLVHRTSNQYPAQQRIGAPVSPAGSFNQQLAQFARATSPLQAMQSFQQQQQQQQQQLFLPPPQQQQQQLQSSQMQPQQVTQQVIRATNDLQQYQQQQQPQLGTRKLLDGRCGLRQSSGINGRVQNLQYSENAAEFGEYPAQAAILKRLNGSESLFVCSGTLISQSWVATAAHCIRKHAQGELKVRLGEWDVHRDDEFYGYVEKQVRDLIIHPEFVAGNLINDIALLRLESPIDATLPHINPACLPSSDESFARQRCWVTGWGKDSFGQKGSFQAVLQEVELPVLTNANCEQALRQTRLGPHYRLHPGFICAGGEGGRDACEGDGGSGLYCVQDGGVIKVAGLVSWGIGCGQAGVPGVYVGMAHYRPWIENIISIDEDIYSSYNSLPFGMPNTLISERSNDASNSSTTVAIATTAAEAMQSSV